MRGSTMRESVTDVRIILECLQEAYQMEGDMVRSGKNIHATMIYPFVRMLQEKCRDCLLYTSPSPRDLSTSRMPSSA